MITAQRAFAIQAGHGKAVFQVTPVERRTRAKARQQSLAGGLEIGIEAQGLAEVRLGLAMRPALQGGPTGVGMRRGVFGIAGEHAGEVRGVVGLLGLQAERLGELIGRAGIIGIEGEGLPGGTLRLQGQSPQYAARPARLGGVRVGRNGIEGETYLGGIEGFLRAIERAEDEGAQDVVLPIVRLDRDGPVDGGQGLLAEFGNPPLTAGELMQREGVFRSALRKSASLKGARGSSALTAQLLELQPAEELRMRNPALIS